MTFVAVDAMVFCFFINVIIGFWKYGALPDDGTLKSELDDADFVALAWRMLALRTRVVREMTDEEEAGLEFMITALRERVVRTADDAGADTVVWQQPECVIFETTEELAPLKLCSAGKKSIYCGVKRQETDCASLIRIAVAIWMQTWEARQCCCVERAV